jgi:4-hydroxybenzoate polyprenyltransferase
MRPTAAPQALPSRLAQRVVDLGHLVRFSHSIFALPFALASAACAAARAPLTLVRLGWILIAMVSARTAAMAFNRFADRELDAANPRTRDREIPRGIVSPGTALGLTVLCAAIFVAAAAALGRLPLVLSPVALLILLGYSYAKRFTWASHLVLGLALAGAPLGAWIAVTGSLALEPCLLAVAVLSWVAGFDTIYACQDVAFDRAQKLQSLPARFGIANALRISRTLHVIAVAALVAFGYRLALGPIYAAGVAVVAGVLLYEHSIVSADDLSRVNRAFFDLNGLVSLVYLVAVLASHPWNRP